MAYPLVPLGDSTTVVLWPVCNPALAPVSGVEGCFVSSPDLSTHAISYEPLALTGAVSTWMAVEIPLALVGLGARSLRVRDNGCGTSARIPLIR